MDRSIEIIWGVDRGFFLKVGILAVGAGGDGIVNVFSNIIIFFWPTASIRGWRTFGAGYRSPFFEICLMTPRTQTPAIYSTFIGIILIMVDLFIFFFPGGVFMIPSTKIVIANTLRNYSANFRGVPSLGGRITTGLIIEESRYLIANCKFRCIDFIITSITGITGGSFLGRRKCGESIIFSGDTASGYWFCATIIDGVNLSIVNW